MLVFFVNPNGEIGSRFTGPMNRFDIQFWNGALKGLLLAEKEVSELSCSKCPTEGCQARERLTALVRKIESIHSKNLEAAIQSTP